jgi:ATP-dependent Clp protease ATP-binding subunit ClpA
MFERFTDPARRALFFARCAVSELGAPQVGAEHILLGLCQAADVLAPVFGRWTATPQQIRAAVEDRSLFREKIPMSVEIRFSAEAQHVLEFAAEEADRLWIDYIGPEHLLLGLLREERSMAGSVLAGFGFRLEEARQLVADVPAPGGKLGPISSVDRGLDHVNRILSRIEQLDRRMTVDAAPRSLLARIRTDLQELRQLLGGC